MCEEATATSRCRLTTNQIINRVVVLPKKKLVFAPRKKGIQISSIFIHPIRFLLFTMAPPEQQSSIRLPTMVTTATTPFDLNLSAKPQKFKEIYSFRSDKSSSESDSNTNGNNRVDTNNINSSNNNSKIDGTYAAQTRLPRLPIPALEDTLKKFPLVLEALQDDVKQRNETQRVVQEFLHNEGPILQQALIDYERAGVESGDIGSYVEEFWNESYLSPDTSVVLNLNPFFVLEDGPDPMRAVDQLARAASLVMASLKIASALRHETMAPDVFKGRPLCMDQYKALFGASRQPTEHANLASSCDEVHVYKDSSHGKVFGFRVIISA